MNEIDHLLSLSPGAVFRACDLHVHTPASMDMDPRWKDAPASALVEAAVKGGLDVIAVTDHNTVDWCDAVREAAEETPLLVLPGVEISTSEGHILAIFDRSKSSSELREFLVQLDIREKDFGNLETISARRFDETARAIEGEGGIAIAAHADRERGFLQMVKTGARRKEIINCSEVRAFELVDAGLREKFERGDPSREARSVGCVQGSDSWPKAGNRHQLDAVGQRRTYVKMDEISVWALRQACFDPELRIRMETDEKPTPSMVIEGIWVTGGFLSDQIIKFSEEISCLIGDTGSGKSLTLELLRFALDQQVEVVLPKIREEVDRLLQFGLNEMDTVFVLLRKGASRYLVERPWLPTSSPRPIVHRVPADETTELEQPIHVPSFFPIKGYSQSEIIEYAREPLARLTLIDGLIDISPEQDGIAKSKSELRRNATELLRLKTQLKRDEQSLGQLPGLTEEIARLSEFLKHPEVKQQEKWQEEETLFDDFARGLQSLGEIVAEEFPKYPLSLPSAEDLPEDPVNPEVVEQLELLSGLIQDKLKQSKDDLAASVSGFEEELGSIRGTWTVRFEAAQRKYKALAAGLKEATYGQGAVLSRLSDLRQSAQRLRALRRSLDNEVEPRIRELAEKRDELLTQLQSFRKQLTDKRRRKADQLSRAREQGVNRSEPCARWAGAEKTSNGHSDGLARSRERHRANGRVAPPNTPCEVVARRRLR